MDAETQAVKRGEARPEGRPLYVVGMDAHSKKLAVSVWEWSDPWKPTLRLRIPSFSIEAMEKTYERHVPLDSITLIEASTNSAHLKRTLEGMGYRAEVVRSDVVSGRERKRKVCDVRDADNIALAYIHGDAGEFVWTPTDECAERRDILFAYRDCQKDLTRTGNRIWSICSRKGFRFAITGGTTTAEAIGRMVESAGIEGVIRRRLDMLVEDYGRCMRRRDELKALMAETVFGSNDMIALMQLPGVNYRVAFATIAAVGDARRFPKASKLAAYGGFSPTVDTSGDEEERARRKGGTGKPLDDEGRRDLKSLYVEAAQAVLTTCGDSTLGKWGWRLINSGKPRNKAVCAVARKLLTYAWHILHGDPTPSREAEKFFRRKLVRFCGTLGARRIKELGFARRELFAERHVARLYSHLPQEPAAVEESPVPPEPLLV